jgi:molecular chaperone DnaJ
MSAKTTMRDYYEILGIPRGASADDIRQAYRSLAKQYHPDVNSEPGAEDKFKEINEAYAVLSNDERRSAYDRFGHDGLKGMPFDFNFDFGLGDIFEEFFGFNMGGSSRRRAPRRGADLRYSIELSFEEAVFGVTKEIDFERHETCSRCSGAKAEPGTSPVRCNTCNGSGEVRQVRQTLLGSMVNVGACPNCRGSGEIISTPCSTCRGSGYERKAVKKDIEIPAGIDDGNQIRVSGEGEPGSNKGPRGNLYVAIRVKPHKYFRRRNNDILLDLSINIAQAVLGGDIDVPTLEGEEKLRIPAGTQPGKVFKLRNRGVPKLRSNGRGNQLVVVSVDVPRTLSVEQRQLFEQLAETLGTEVRLQERSFLEAIKEFLGGLAD